MIRSLYISVSGMRSHQTKLDCVGNNLANVNTPGYKNSRSNFQESFCQALAGPGQNIVLGNGVQTVSSTPNMLQGGLLPTGRTMDLAVQGAGFFGLEGPGGEAVFTRDGSFSFDAEGNLVNAGGLKVLDDDESPINIKLSGDSFIESIEISPEGMIKGLLSDGDDFEAQLGLYGFPNPEGLTRLGSGLYGAGVSSGEQVAGIPGEEGMGQLLSGYLEGPNTDMVQEMTELVSAQRGYQANARVFTTSEQVIQETIDLKR